MLIDKHFVFHDHFYLVSDNEGNFVSRFHDILSTSEQIERTRGTTPEKHVDL
jgi:hypothetical protein